MTRTITGHTFHNPHSATGLKKIGQRKRNAKVYTTEIISPSFRNKTDGTAYFMTAFWAQRSMSCLAAARDLPTGSGLARLAGVTL